MYKSNCHFRVQILSKIGNPCISRSSYYVPPLGAQNEGAVCSDYRIRDLDLARCVCVVCVVVMVLVLVMSVEGTDCN